MYKTASLKSLPQYMWNTPSLYKIAFFHVFAVEKQQLQSKVLIHAVVQRYINIFPFIHPIMPLHIYIPLQVAMFTYMYSGGWCLLTVTSYAYVFIERKHVCNMVKLMRIVTMHLNATFCRHKANVNLWAIQQLQSYDSHDFFWHGR